MNNPTLEFKQGLKYDITKTNKQPNCAAKANNLCSLQNTSRKIIVSKTENKKGIIKIIKPIKPILLKISK